MSRRHFINSFDVFIRFNCSIIIQNIIYLKPISKSLLNSQVNCDILYHKIDWTGFYVYFTGLLDEPVIDEWFDLETPAGGQGSVKIRARLG